MSRNKCTTHEYTSFFKPWAETSTLHMKPRKVLRATNAISKTSVSPNHVFECLTYVPLKSLYFTIHWLEQFTETFQKTKLLVKQRSANLFFHCVFMYRVTQTTKCLEKTPQIHDLCPVLFDPASDHVINNEEIRAGKNTHIQVDEAIKPDIKVWCLKSDSTALYGPRITSQSGILSPVATKIDNSAIFIYNAIWKSLSTRCILWKFSRAYVFQIKPLPTLDASHDRSLGILTNGKPLFPGKYPYKGNDPMFMFSKTPVTSLIDH